MVSLFNAIKTKLQTIAPELKFIAMYNQQLDDLGGENGSETYSYPFPCAFIEFDDDIEFKQLGAGVQIVDPLFATIHIGYNELDAMDGTLDQNLNVYLFVQKIFKGFNKFEATGSGMFIRYGHTQDKHHRNVYHFSQKYKTTWIDNERIEPVDGVTKEPPTDLDLTVTYNPSPFLKQL